MKKHLKLSTLISAIMLTAQASAQTQEVCKGSQPPQSGWVITNIYTAQGKCGGPPYDLNMQTIVNTTKMRNGTTLEICAWQTIPNGWNLVAPWQTTSYGRCGNYPYTYNTWIIRKGG